MTNNLEHMTIECQPSTEYYNLQLIWKDRHSNEHRPLKTQTKNRRKRHFPFIYDDDASTCLAVHSAKLYIKIT